jgi:putative phosphoesterase
MKLVIASDIHGSALYCRQLLDAWDREKPEEVVLLGDILYHGPRNDLPEAYDPKSVLGLLNERRDRILCVRGNCDTEVDQMVLNFPILADYVWLYLDGLSVLATHGHHHNTATPPPLKKGDILLHGHTHVLKIEEFGNGNWYINPGSAALPKENNPRTYAIYENRRFTIKDFDGNTVLEKQF